MSKQANPTLIGAFVIGAVALLVIAVILFGGADLFAKRSAYIAYFTGTTWGLRKGSNVTMNGVYVGYVSNIVLHVNVDTFQNLTAVTIELLPEFLVLTRDGKVIGTGAANKTPHEELVNIGGLRAQLESESLVTGQLRIELSFQPDTPRVMRGGDNPPLHEIPTIPNDFRRIMEKLQRWMTEFTRDIDARELSAQIQSIFEGVDELANSPELRQILMGANSIINSEDTQRLSTSIEVTLEAFRDVASDAQSLLTNADAKLDTDVRPLIEKLAATIDEAQGALAAAKRQLRGDSVQVYQLDGALKEFEAAARAMREFLDYLDRHPEAILRGKKP